MICKMISELTFSNVNRYNIEIYVYILNIRSILIKLTLKSNAHIDHIHVCILNIHLFNIFYIIYSIKLHQQVQDMAETNLILHYLYIAVRVDYHSVPESGNMCIVCLFQHRIILSSVTLPPAYLSL